MWFLRAFVTFCLGTNNSLFVAFVVMGGGIYNYGRCLSPLGYQAIKVDNHCLTLYYLCRTGWEVGCLAAILLIYHLISLKLLDHDLKISIMRWLARMQLSQLYLLRANSQIVFIRLSNAYIHKSFKTLSKSQTPLKCKEAAVAIYNRIDSSVANQKTACDRMLVSIL